MKKFAILFLFAIGVTSCENFTEEIFDVAKDKVIETRATGSESGDYYWYQGKK